MTTYEKELELLIIETLLPAYIREQCSKGNKEPTKGINPALLLQLSKATNNQIPALLRAY